MRVNKVINILAETFKLKDMESYTNIYGKEFKVGQVGVMYSRFKKEQIHEEYYIDSITPSGKYLRMLPVNKTGNKRIDNSVLLVNTSDCNIKGSHLGNSYFLFNDESN